jgi:uncharacterized protein (DUF427 family)
MDVMKTPGPDHPITVEANPKRIQVKFNGHVIVDSSKALTLREAGYRPVLYFPREDVAMEYFSRTDRVTHCPYKGHAHYYTMMMDGQFAENAVWTYEDPYPAMDVIRGYLAFYPNVVEFHEVEDGRRAMRPDEVVLHTDAGDGHSQAQHWAANVDAPPVLPD